MSQNLIVSDNNAPLPVVELFSSFVSSENKKKHAILSFSEDDVGIVLIVTQRSPYIYFIASSETDLRKTFEFISATKILLEDNIPNIQPMTVLIGEDSNLYDRCIAKSIGNPWDAFAMDQENGEDSDIIIETLRILFDPNGNEEEQESILISQDMFEIQGDETIEGTMSRGHSISVVNGQAISDVNPVIKIIKDAMQQASGGKPIKMDDMELNINSVAGASQILPAIMVMASIKWAPVVLHAEGQGAFQIQLASTNVSNSALGYVLSGIKCDDFLILAVPVLETFRRLYDEKRQSFNIMPAIKTMKKWLERHNYDTYIIDELLMDS